MTSQHLTLIAATSAAAFVWWFLAAVHADLPCTKCEGKGRFPNPWGSGTRPCGRCNGRGKRTRLARHVWDWVFNTTREDRPR